MKQLARLLPAAALALGAITCARAQVSVLGGALNYAGLELNAAKTFTISSGNTIVTGNIGVAANGTLNFSGGGTVTGEVDAGSGAKVTISGGSVADGGTVEPDAGLAAIISQAYSAATYYSGLSATQTFGNIGASTTFTGSGGLNVIDVNGNINLQGGSALTLTGGANDQFVINVDASSGVDLTLGGGSSIVLNGISANQVVFNLVGTGTQLNSNGNSLTNGVFLAASGDEVISGGVHDSDFISGGALTFQSGPHITEVPAISAVPELSTWLMGLGGLALLALLHRRLRSPALA